MDQALQQLAETYSVVKEQMVLQQACEPNSKLVKATAHAAAGLKIALHSTAMAAKSLEKQRQEAVLGEAMQRCWASTLLSQSTGLNADALMQLTLLQQIDLNQLVSYLHQHQLQMFLPILQQCVWGPLLLDMTSGVARFIKQTMPQCQEGVAAAACNDALLLLCQLQQANQQGRLESIMYLQLCGELLTADTPDALIIQTQHVRAQLCIHLSQQTNAAPAAAAAAAAAEPTGNSTWQAEYTAADATATAASYAAPAAASGPFCSATWQAEYTAAPAATASPFGTSAWQAECAAAPAASEPIGASTWQDEYTANPGLFSAATPAAPSSTAAAFAAVPANFADGVEAIAIMQSDAALNMSGGFTAGNISSSSCSCSSYDDATASTSSAADGSTMTGEGSSCIGIIGCNNSSSECNGAAAASALFTEPEGSKAKAANTVNILVWPDLLSSVSCDAGSIDSSTHTAQQSSDDAAAVNIAAEAEPMAVSSSSDCSRCTQQRAAACLLLDDPSETACSSSRAVEGDESSSRASSNSSSCGASLAGSLSLPLAADGPGTPAAVSLAASCAASARCSCTESLEGGSSSSDAGLLPDSSKKQPAKKQQRQRGRRVLRRVAGCALFVAGCAQLRALWRA
jgi:hypothetical protein